MQQLSEAASAQRQPDTTPKHTSGGDIARDIGSAKNKNKVHVPVTNSLSNMNNAMGRLGNQLQEVKNIGGKTAIVKPTPASPKPDAMMKANMCKDAPDDVLAEVRVFLRDEACVHIGSYGALVM